MIPPSMVTVPVLAPWRLASLVTALLSSGPFYAGQDQRQPSGNRTSVVAQIPVHRSVHVAATKLIVYLRTYCFANEVGYLSVPPRHILK